MNTPARADHRSAHADTFVRDHLPAAPLQPDLLLGMPSLRFPARLNCAWELLEGSGTLDRSPRTALLSPHGVRWTYRELTVKVARIFHVLTEDMGLVPGNRVLLHGANTPMLAAIWLAVVRAGGVVVAAAPTVRADRLGEVIDKARVTHALCEWGLRPELESSGRTPRTLSYGDPHADASLERAMLGKPDWSLPVDTAATDPCLIAFTAGTMDTPKATVHSHRDVMAACRSFPEHVLKATADDRFIGSPSLADTYGLGGLLLFPLHLGASTVLLDTSSPRQLARSIGEFGATVCFSGPARYQAICADTTPYDLSTLRECVSSGEPLEHETRRRWKQRTGNSLIDGLSSTELLHVFVSMRGEEAWRRPGAIGRPVPGYLVAVIDGSGRPLPHGEVGALAVKGPTGCRYLDDERQRDAVRSGWTFTGDACWADEEGYLYHHSRTAAPLSGPGLPRDSHAG
ncbi:AMP-binding protein [Streptomyces sp. cg36]|uniref:AMP-binding protein n=1 Tax=Streptomyces sp. cg36 TaxID=3238798 RepID=UPI0034E2D9FC